MRTLTLLAFGVVILGIGLILLSALTAIVISMRTVSAMTLPHDGCVPEMVGEQSDPAEPLMILVCWDQAGNLTAGGASRLSGGW